MENVSGMSSYQIKGDPIVDIIKKKFVGYNVEEKILSTADYGVPQDRKRIIFIGYKNKGVKPCEFPKITHSENRLTAFDAIRDLVNVKPTENGKINVKDTDIKSEGSKFRKRMRNWKCIRPDGTIVKCINGELSSHFTRNVNDRDVVLFKYIKSGSPRLQKGNLEFKGSTPRQIYGDIYPNLWNSDLQPAFKEAGMKAWKKDGRHHVQNQDGKKWLMYPAKGFKDKMRRIKWDKPAPTVVAHLSKDGYMFIHPFEDRTITVREAARFQSFPDSFEFMGTISSQYRQVGNAVPPILAEVIGLAIIEAINTNE